MDVKTRAKKHLERKSKLQNINRRYIEAKKQEIIGEKETERVREK